MLPESKRYVQEQRRKRGLCVICGKEDAFTMIGKRLCADCTEKHRQATADWYENNRERITKSERDQRSERIENHQCTVCGKPLPENFKLHTCEECRKKANLRRRRNRVHKIIPPGLCGMCHREPVLPGKRICAKCDAVAAERMRKAREARRK